MLPVLKIMLFPLLAGIVCLLGYRAYRYFNEKINGSRTIWHLLFYSLSLIAINMGIIMVGIWTLMTVYEFLS